MLMERTRSAGTRHSSRGTVQSRLICEMKRVALCAGDVSWLRSDMFVRLPSPSEANNFGRCAATLVCFSDTASEAVVRVAHVAVERAGRVASEELVISLRGYQNGSFEMICNRYPPTTPPAASAHQGPCECVVSENMCSSRRVVMPRGHDGILSVPRSLSVGDDMALLDNAPRRVVDGRPPCTASLPPNLRDL